MISETLKTLLRYTKTTDEQRNWRTVRDVLAPLYNHDMRLIDVMSVLTKAHGEALAEPRFNMSRGGSVADLLLAPVKGFTSVELYGPTDLDTTYTVEQFYDAIIAHMLSDLRFTKVDWLYADPPPNQEKNNV